MGNGNDQLRQLLPKFNQVSQGLIMLAMLPIGKSTAT
jgi:hypothetical protein